MTGYPVRRWWAEWLPVPVIQLVVWCGVSPLRFYRLRFGPVRDA